MALMNSNIKLVSITPNLVDQAWGSEKPLVLSQPIYVLQEAFTGDSLSPFSFPT